MRRSRKLALAIAVTASATLAITQAAAAVAQPGTTGLGAATVFAQQPLTAQEAAALSQNANTSVIVVMRNQPAVAAVNTPAATTRSHNIASMQAPVVSELSQVHAKRVKAYKVANVLAATVSKGEAARLAANPAVAQVLPDSVVKGTPDQAAAAAAAAADPGAPASTALCPAPGAKPLLEPEALDVTHTDSDDPSAKTARSLGYTGAGVKVAYIADGIDINNPDFIRADGSHVFADYEDFTGDGPNAPTSADEAFLDASAIAAQGRQTYDISNFGAHPLSGPCDVRIEGVAPGASLYGFKIFGQQNATTTSGILQAIDWAVDVDHVNVINESFGSNPYPDTPAQDAVALFNDDAVAAGVTVTTSSGDAGPTSTTGSPATDPSVISVGASTTFRWLQQTDYAAAQTFAPGGGWLNDNISTLSSSGVSQGGRTIDLVAPGDSSFALCTANTAVFEGCTNFNGQPSDVERSGGTSESSPITAGAAALVIQSYRQAHHGATPTPALVKQILVSTADDLTVPGDEQGAGRLDTYKAVLAAKSVKTKDGSPAASGSTLLVNKTQLDATGATGSSHSFKLNVTNTGAKAQTVNLSGRGFGPDKHTTTGSVTLSDTASPHLADWSGVNNNFGQITFTVPAGQQRLTANIAYPGDPNGSLNARVRLDLVDPKGRLAAHSLPQGVGNAGFADVRFPTAGTWTADIFGIDGADGGTEGKVLFTESSQNTTGFGSVSPSVLHLAPGQTGTVTVTAKTPNQPGDASGAVVLDAGAGNQTSVPVIVRSLIAASGKGAFSGTLVGGNGRQSNAGQENFYQFNVPAGTKNISASVDITEDATDNVAAYLIDPEGVAVATSTNRLTTEFNFDTGSLNQSALTQTDVYANAPQAGRWSLLVNFAGAVAGDILSQPFHGTIGLNKVDVKANGLPNSTGTTLKAGKAVTVPVKVKNNGTAPEDFFVDPRLNTTTSIHPTALGPTTVALPTRTEPVWFVPSETTGVAIVANATQPMEFDFGPFAGDPDLPSDVNGLTAVASYHANPVPQGLWFALASETGPTPANGGIKGSATFDMVAQTKGFDPAVTSSATDLWQGAVSDIGELNLVTVQPGQTVTIPVTITPSGPVGSTVTGTLYVDQLAVDNSDVTNESANELTGLPYQYKIG
jgi:hypothetical protein